MGQIRFFFFLLHRSRQPLQCLVWAGSELVRLVLEVRRARRSCSGSVEIAENQHLEPAKCQWWVLLQVVVVILLFITRNRHKQIWKMQWLRRDKQSERMLRIREKQKQELQNSAIVSQTRMFLKGQL